MRNLLWILLPVIIAATLAGCTGYGQYLLTKQTFPATDPKQVKVYALSEPTGNYDVIGYISVYGSDAQNEGDKLRDQLKERAAKLGATAVIGFKLNQAVSGGGGAEGIAVRMK
jgi:hypothetical protein